MAQNTQSIHTNFVIECPHCLEEVIIESVNCAIFRHGIYKTNLEQIPPHSTKNECDRLLVENLIYGCSKPFQLKLVENKYIAEICDYI